jgi:hypothetical protein
MVNQALKPVAIAVHHFDDACQVQRVQVRRKRQGASARHLLALDSIRTLHQIRVLFDQAGCLQQRRILVDFTAQEAVDHAGDVPGSNQPELLLWAIRHSAR